MFLTSEPQFDHYILYPRTYRDKPTKAFMEEYWAAIEGDSTNTSATTTALTPGTFYWLTHQYYNSARFESFDTDDIINEAGQPVAVAPCHFE